MISGKMHRLPDVPAFDQEEARFTALKIIETNAPVSGRTRSKLEDLIDGLVDPREAGREVRSVLLEFYPTFR